MSKHNAYPTKTTLNLMIRERQGWDPRVLIPLALVGAVLVTLFCRYAVIERLAEASRAEQAAIAVEQELRSAQNELTAYDEVEAQYSRYFSDALFSKDIPQECMDVLAVMEDNLMDKAWINAYSFSGNTLQLQLEVEQLSVTAQLIEALYQVPMVDNVTIATATDTLYNTSITDLERETSGRSTVIMTITLREVEQK